MFVASESGEGWGGGGGWVVRESDYCTPSQFHAPRPIQVSQNVLRMVHWPRQENIFGICYLIVEIHEQAWVVQKSTTTYYLTKHDAAEYFPRTISRCTGDVFYTEPRNWKGGGVWTIPSKFSFGGVYPASHPLPLLLHPCPYFFVIFGGKFCWNVWLNTHPFSLLSLLLWVGVSWYQLSYYLVWWSLHLQWKKG